MKRPSTHSYGAILIVMAICLQAGRAGGEERYDLRLKPVEGDRYAFDSTSSMQQNVQVTQDGQLSRQVNAATTRTRKGLLEILKVRDDDPVMVRITFDPHCLNSGGPDGETGDKPFPLAGQTLVVLREPDGKITTDSKTPLDEDTQAEASKFVQPERGIYPSRPVAVGESWSADPRQMGRQFQLGPDDSCDVKCRLLSIKEVDGRRAAEVSLTGTVIKTEQGFVRTRIELDGVTLLDLRSGEPLQTHLDGKVAISGTQTVSGKDGRPIKVEVAGDGTLEVRQITRILTSDAAAPPPVPGPAPAAPVAQDRYAGTFENEQLLVQVDAPKEGVYSGTITLGGKNFPLIARVDGNALRGTFESDGNQFNFTAVRDADTLRLSSDGANYVLERRAENPLRAGSVRQPASRP